MGEPGDWRFCLSTTAPIEIAASAAIAIRIGIKGEEPPSLEALLAAWPCVTPAEPWPAVAPLPGLPWPVPPPLPVPGLSLACATAPPVDDPSEEDPESRPPCPGVPEAVAPPFE
jgi:hypothetical protein